MNRMEYYVNGQITMQPTTENGYMNWYLQRTVIHIVKPNNENSFRYQNFGGTLELAVCIYICIIIFPCLNYIVIFINKDSNM